MKPKTQKQHTTVADVLGGLTKEAIAAVTDVHLRETLTEAYAFASGVAEVLLGDASDANVAHAQAVLGEVHVTLDDATGTVNDALTLLAEIADRDAKNAAYHVAVAEVTATERSIAGHLASTALLLRAKFGSKSPELKQFGVKPFAPGGRHAKKQAAAAAGSGGNTPPGT